MGVGVVVDDEVVVAVAAVNAAVVATNALERVGTWFT